MTEKEKMLSGALYDASDDELVRLRQKAKTNMALFNQEEDAQKRSQLVKTWFGKTGEQVHLKARFVCDYGSNIYLGENFYANFNCTMLDVCEIHIGDNAMLGPNVQLLTPLHPLNAKERISGLEYGAPIHIGDNVWIGGGATILPGVTLGDNVVVGAGSVVTKSFGDNVLIAGNPARIIKTISEENEAKKWTIRPFQKADLKTILQIWLTTNLAAHDFIAPDYWLSHYDLVKDLLPQAEIYVAENEQNEILGFIGLNQDHIEGIFVKQEAQQKGVGKELLAYAKNLKDQLTLEVYQKNTRALSFYQKEGFLMTSQAQTDQNEIELTMIWHKN